MATSNRPSTFVKEILKPCTFLRLFLSSPFKVWGIELHGDSSTIWEFFKTTQAVFHKLYEFRGFLRFVSCTPPRNRKYWYVSKSIEGFKKSPNPRFFNLVHNSLILKAVGQRRVRICIAQFIQVGNDGALCWPSFDVSCPPKHSKIEKWKTSRRTRHLLKLDKNLKKTPSFLAFRDVFYGFEVCDGEPRRRLRF